jgi:sugar phosphate isomerase/epimerase
MNIEESDLFQPILDAGDRLGYLHIGESHRGYLGTGSVDFGSAFRALDRINYDGPIVFESFSSAVVSATFEQHSRHLAKPLERRRRFGRPRQPLHPRPTRSGSDD